MGKHKATDKMLGAYMDRSYDTALKDLARKVGLKKSDLIRRAIIEFMATTNQLTSWRTIIGRQDDNLKK